MNEPKFRLMHTMVRVKDLDTSLDFYTRLLGMQLLRRADFPEGKFTLAFVAYGPEDSHAAVELTHNWDQEAPYDLGTGYVISLSACGTSMPSARGSRPPAPKFRARLGP